MGSVAPPPIFSNLQESWSKVSQAARGLATVFSVTCFIESNNSWSIGQNAPQQVSRHITGDDRAHLGEVAGLLCFIKTGPYNLYYKDNFYCESKRSQI